MAEEVILSIEAAVGAGSISLLRGKEVFGGHLFDSEGSRSEDILPGVQELLDLNKVSRVSLKTIVVSTGYGSLTGQRVGLATAIGLKNSLSAEMFQVDLGTAIIDELGGDSINKIIVLPYGKTKIQAANPKEKKSTGVRLFNRDAGSLDELRREFEGAEYRLILHDSLASLIARNFERQGKVLTTVPNLSIYSGLFYAKRNR